MVTEALVVNLLMEERRKISTLSDSMVLNWWANEPAGRDYAYVASMARHQGCRINANQARRDVQRRLKRLQLIPLTRKPTSQDYLAAKQKWRDRWYGTDIV